MTKKSTSILLLILGLMLCSGCSAAKMGQDNYIERAELTQKEAQLVDLLGNNGEVTIYDFRVDEKVETLEITAYELVDGTWVPNLGSGMQGLEKGSGRIALRFPVIAGKSGEISVAIQTDGETGGFKSELTMGELEETDGMAAATSALNERREIVYDTEIPLAVQIRSGKNRVESLNVEYFHKPEEYAKHEYEHVYAVTVCFSEKTMEELNRE